MKKLNHLLPPAINRLINKKLIDKLKNQTIKSQPSALKNEKGAAIMVALFMFTIITMVLASITKETTVEALGASQKLSDLRAQYTAKAGLELGLLRVLMYKQAVHQLKDKLKDTSMLDEIWSFPFTWPPPPLDGLTKVDQSNIKKVQDKSFLKNVEYQMSIEPQDGGLNPNDLASPIEALAKGTRKQLLTLFERKYIDDLEFERRYPTETLESALNNIKDWADLDTTSDNGRGELDVYEDLYEIDFPPNTQLKSINQLKLIPEITDELFDILKNNITLVGVKSININQATKEQLLSLSSDPNWSDEIVDELMTNRSLENYAPETFEEYVTGAGLDYNELLENNPAFVFSAPLNFKIEVFGLAGRSQKALTAYTFDMDQLIDPLIKQLEAQDKANDPSANNGSQANGNESEPSPTTPDANDPNKQPATAEETKKENKAPQGRPRVVYLKLDSPQ